MKRLIALAFVALFSMSAMAQQVDLRKKINVSGSAETEVTPDIIYLSISLKEYLKDNNSKKKSGHYDLGKPVVQCSSESGHS